MPEQMQGYFKPRGSGGKANNALKETSSTLNSNEGLATCKSERTFPSFLRSQTKSPPKFKLLGKEGISKQNFKFIKKLGEGKFGSVYLARDMLTGMIVGLKVVQKKRIIKDNFLVQFIRQLKIQSFLDHPNIIKVYGYFHDEENVYIVLQLGCDGQLFDVISNGSTLSEQTTSFIVGNLLDALHLMHKHKILHRDIKPENIVLVHVILYLFRETLSFVILVGLSTKNRNLEVPFVELLFICLLSYCKVPGTMKRLTSGLLEFWLMNFFMENRLSTSTNMKIWSKQ